MTTSITAEEVALRLLLTVVAGAVIGINRTERGRAAGLRTTILVCLAASVSMIQANLLLGTAGKAADSFVVLDLMRLPLGILSGMGFIGAGAILRQGKMIFGVTTAATLWFVTVMGLCFGGGQLWLGGAMLALGAFVLWVLKWLEIKLDRDRHGWLAISCQSTSFDLRDLRQFLKGQGFHSEKWQTTFVTRDSSLYLKCLLQWRGEPDDNEPPAVVKELANRPGVRKVSWKA
jgi:putative Mg2+ transporter-C (MgtC) family protein